MCLSVPCTSTSFNMYIYIRYIHDVYIYIYLAWHGTVQAKLANQLIRLPFSIPRISYFSVLSSPSAPCDVKAWRRGLKLGNKTKTKRKQKNIIFNKTETMILGREVRILYLLWVAKNLPQVDGCFIIICKGKWCLSLRWSRILAPAHLGLGCYGFSIMGMFSAIPTTEEKVAYLRDTSKTIFRQRSLAINMNTVIEREVLQLVEGHQKCMFSID